MTTGQCESEYILQRKVEMGKRATEKGLSSETIALLENEFFDVSEVDDNQVVTQSSNEGDRACTSISGPCAFYEKHRVSCKHAFKSQIMENEPLLL